MCMSLQAPQRGRGAASPAASMACIVQQNFAYIVGLLERFGVPPSDREDVAQEVLLGAYRALSRYDPSRAKLRSWLYKIAFYQAQSFLDRAYHRREVPLTDRLLQALVDDGSDAEEQVIADETRRTVRAQIARIPVERRAVLVAYAIEEKAMLEVAETLGIPISTGWSRLQAARRDLREGLDRCQRRCRWERR
jgi:RNA polymerase sigma factor (sigma-70 family)